MKRLLLFSKYRFFPPTQNITHCHLIVTSVASLLCFTEQDKVEIISIRNYKYADRELGCVGKNEEEERIGSGD